jgi:hypothetical protein
VEAVEAPIVAVANIPDVTGIPFVTTVPLGPEPTLPSLRWNMMEDLDDDGDDVVFVLLSAPVADPNEAPAYVPDGGGASADTLGSEFTLTASEVAEVQGLVAAFNDVIEAQVTARGFALVDVEAAFAALPNDPTNPANFAVANAIFPWLPNAEGTGFFRNGMAIFSLDGIHPSEKGGALIANEFIAAINAAYGTTIPAVDADAIENLLGFEEAPGKTMEMPAPSGPLFTSEGMAALRALAGMLSSN